MEYSVTVKPGTSQEKIVENPDGTLTVFLRAKPHDGEANAALVKILAKHFHVAKSLVRIKSGGKSRQKRVVIEK